MAPLPTKEQEAKRHALLYQVNMIMSEMFPRPPLKTVLKSYISFDSLWHMWQNDNYKRKSNM